MMTDSKIYIALFAFATVPILTNWISLTSISNISLSMLCIMAGIGMYTTEWIFKDRYS